MNNGGGKSGRQPEQPNTTSRRRKLGSGNDDFAQTISRIAVAQVCESKGFQAFQQSALDALSDVAARYILEIGKSANCYANLAGRSESNVFDVIQGLEDLGSVQGFSAASDIDHCLEFSGVVREIVQFVNDVEPVVFAHPIPRFPVVKERILSPSFLQRGVEPPEEHIPPWLPAFPDPKKDVEFEHERENGKGEMLPVLNVQQQQQQQPSNMFENSTMVDAKGKRVVAESNPFLAAPLKIDDKEVDPVVPPAKFFSNVPHDDNPVAENFVENEPVSVLETFAPAIEAMRSKFDGDSKEEDQNKFPVKEKSNVRFKIGTKNKLLGRSIGLILDKEDERNKTLPWFAMEDEKDDRKRRAENILRGSLENPDQLVQL